MNSYHHCYFVLHFWHSEGCKQSCSSLNLYWCALSCTKKICLLFSCTVGSSMSDGSSHCQGSWIAMSNVEWIHVSTWMQDFFECKKANESVGCLRWTPWWLPLLVLGSLFETCFRKVIIVEALLSDNFVQFCKTNVLETLTYKVEQWWTIFCESKEVLGLKWCLFGGNVSGNTQMAMLCTKHMTFQKYIRV